MTDHNTRQTERATFLSAAGWADAVAHPLAGDASTRSYERLELGAQRAILMNAPGNAEAASCPPGATPTERARLGYNAEARLAGPNLHAFIEIATTLTAAGFSAPRIYATDPDLGFALIEDLGDDLFARAIPAGADEHNLYTHAVDTLLALRRRDIRPPATDRYTMLSYDPAAMQAEIRLLPQWYAPFRTGRPSDAGAVASYDVAWADVLAKLSPPSVAVLRDFHAENLLWLPDRAGTARVGLIDFQDALTGHAAYDLVSLLEDARRDVPHALAADMIARYCAGASGIEGFDEAAFRREYAILGAQRNAKILGIFARLVRRDNKPRYERLLPRVEAHVRNDLRHPALADVADATAQLVPGLFGASA